MLLSIQCSVCGGGEVGLIVCIVLTTQLGRADAMEESPFQTARREAQEEIGLPELDKELPRPFTVEHLCELPANLARTELVVRPCVALLHSYDAATGANEDPEVSLIPRLDAREVAAVFTGPFHNFLRSRDEAEQQIEGENPDEWYQGAWTEWHQSNWRSKFDFFFLFTSFNVLFAAPLLPGRSMSDDELYWLTYTFSLLVHQFFVPVRDRAVVKPRSSRSQSQKEAVEKLAEQENEQEQAGHTTARYRVFGMTARMLVDVARVAYAEEPEFEHNSHFGDEDMIARLRKIGRLSTQRRPSDELTKEDMQRAAKLS